MEKHIPLPPTELDFEGFTEAETVKYRDSTVFHRGKMLETVVHTTEFTTYSNVNLQGDPPADSGQHNSEKPENFHNSHMEVLKAANGSEFPDCDSQTISLMTETIRKSSEDEHQRKLKIFQEYVRSKGLTQRARLVDIILNQR